MSYEVKQPNIFGRIGKGIGQGLSEQLPKEIERSRLSSGLKKLEQEKDLDPLKFFTRAATLPGVTPQLIESLGQLSRQRLQNEAYSRSIDQMSPENQLKNFGYNPSTNLPGEPSEIPSVTTPEPIEATLKPFIPRSFKEQEAAGVAAFQKNPAKYENNIRNAINEQIAIDQGEQDRNIALQQQRKNETDVQNTIRSSLSAQHKLLGGNVPSKTYSKIEDEAIQSVLPVSQGGRGLTEQQAGPKKKTY